MSASLTFLSFSSSTLRFECLWVCVTAELRCVQRCWHYREQSRVAVNITASPHEDWKSMAVQQERAAHTQTHNRTHTHTLEHMYILWVVGAVCTHVQWWSQSCQWIWDLCWRRGGELRTSPSVWQPGCEALCQCRLHTYTHVKKHKIMRRWEVVNLLLSSEKKK